MVRHASHAWYGCMIERPHRRLQCSTNCAFRRPRRGPGLTRSPQLKRLMEGWIVWLTMWETLGGVVCNYSSMCAALCRVARLRGDAPSPVGDCLSSGRKALYAGFFVGVALCFLVFLRMNLRRLRSGFLLIFRPSALLPCIASSLLAHLRNPRAPEQAKHFVYALAVSLAAMYVFITGSVYDTSVPQQQEYYK